MSADKVPIDLEEPQAKITATEPAFVYFGDRFAYTRQH